MFENVTWVERDSAGWPLALPTWIVLRAPAVHGVSSTGTPSINTTWCERSIFKAKEEKMDEDQKKNPVSKKICAPII